MRKTRDVEVLEGAWLPAAPLQNLTAINIFSPAVFADPTRAKFSGARTFRSFEVFPSLGFQFRSHALRIDQKDTFIPSNPTDLRDRKARNSGRNMLIRGRGEKQFVVVAAVERELQLHGMGRFSDAG